MSALEPIDDGEWESRFPGLPRPAVHGDYTEKVEVAGEYGPVDISGCCGSYVTFHDTTLCCKVCWREVIW